MHCPGQRIPTQKYLHSTSIVLYRIVQTGRDPAVARSNNQNNQQSFSNQELAYSLQRCVSGRNYVTLYGGQCPPPVARITISSMMHMMCHVRVCNWSASHRRRTYTCTCITCTSSLQIEPVTRVDTKIIDLDLRVRITHSTLHTPILHIATLSGASPGLG